MVCVCVVGGWGACVGLCVVCRSVCGVCSRGVGVACVGLCVVCV